MADRKAEGRSPIVIEYEEWLSELRAAEKTMQGGLTSDELAEMWNCCQRTASVRIRKLFRAGRIVAGRKPVERVTGGFIAVPAYKIKGKV